MDKIVKKRAWLKKATPKPPKEDGGVMLRRRGASS